MHHLLTIFLIYLQFTDLTWPAEATEPYCIYNQTEYTYRMVNKTREVQVPKPWYKKLSKSATKTEYYEEEERVPKVIPIRRCCEGYEMSKLQLCEPKCLEGCPANSKCVEPEVCKCNGGYFSALSQHGGKHFCEPICEKPCPEHSDCVRPNECSCRTGYRTGKAQQCEPICISGCPWNGTCIAPNHCKCQDGYKSEKGSCIPICSLGDQCKNGICVDTNKCQCNLGFALNEETYKCELNLAIFRESDMAETTPEDWEETTSSHQSDSGFEMDTDTDTFDEAETISSQDEIFESTTWQSYNTDTEESSNKCANDFVLYRGRCQPLKFAIDEIDCRIQPCSDPQALCSDNGTCACREGYKMFRKPINIESTESPQQLVKPVCLSLEEYQKLILIEPEYNVIVSKAEQDQETSNIAIICSIVVGVLVMVSALGYLVFRLLRAQTGQLDVEGKQFACAYDNRSSVNAEKSVI